MNAQMSKCEQLQRDSRILEVNSGWSCRIEEVQCLLYFVKFQRITSWPERVFDVLYPAGSTASLTSLQLGIFSSNLNYCASFCNPVLAVTRFFLCRFWGFLFSVYKFIQKPNPFDLAYKSTTFSSTTSLVCWKSSYLLTGSNLSWLLIFDLVASRGCIHFLKLVLVLAQAVDFLSSQMWYLVKLEVVRILLGRFCRWRLFKYSREFDQEELRDLRQTFSIGYTQFFTVGSLERLHWVESVSLGVRPPGKQQLLMVLLLQLMYPKYIKRLDRVSFFKQLFSWLRCFPLVTLVYILVVTVITCLVRYYGQDFINRNIPVLMSVAISLFSIKNVPDLLIFIGLAFGVLYDEEQRGSCRYMIAFPIRISVLFGLQTGLVYLSKFLEIQYETCSGPVLFGLFVAAEQSVNDTRVVVDILKLPLQVKTTLYPIVLVIILEIIQIRFDVLMGFLLGLLFQMLGTSRLLIFLSSRVTCPKWLPNFVLAPTRPVCHSPLKKHVDHLATSNSIVFEEP